MQKSSRLENNLTLSYPTTLLLLRNTILAIGNDVSIECTCLLILSIDHFQRHERFGTDGRRNELGGSPKLVCSWMKVYQWQLKLTVPTIDVMVKHTLKKFTLYSELKLFINCKFELIFLNLCRLKTWTSTLHGQANTLNTDNIEGSFMTGLVEGWMVAEGIGHLELTIFWHRRTGLMTHVTEEGWSIHVDICHTLKKAKVLVLRNDSIIQQETTQLHAVPTLWDSQHPLDTRLAEQVVVLWRSRKHDYQKHLK